MKTQLYFDLGCWRAQTEPIPDREKASLCGYSQTQNIAAVQLILHRFVTGVASRFSSSLQIKVIWSSRVGGSLLLTRDTAFQIGPLAKSLIKAGELGSAGLPAEAKATQAGKDGARFTVISNAGALAISE
jgi:hypothetical protein